MSVHPCRQVRVPVDMAVKNPRPSCLDELPCRETPGVRLLGAPGTAPSEAPHHGAVTATKARFPNSVVTYGNEHMSTKPRRETAQPLSTATYPHTKTRLPPTAHQSTQAGRSSPSRPAMSVKKLLDLHNQHRSPCQCTVAEEYLWKRTMGICNCATTGNIDDHVQTYCNCGACTVFCSLNHGHMSLHTTGV